MGSKSKIEWTEATWNPVVGCSKVSPGCEHCYAESMHAKRHKAYLAGKKLPAQYAKPFGEIQLFPERLEIPLHWRKPHRIFVCSTGDLFHESVPFEFIDRVFAVMASSARHTYQLLTKRPERALEYFKRVTELGGPAKDRYVTELRAYHEERINNYLEGFTLPKPPTPELRFIYDSACIQERDQFRYERNTKPMGHGFSGGEFHWRPWPLSNVWLGVTVENQEQADRRIPLLLQCPAAVRFVSVEPMLSAVDLTDYLPPPAGGWIDRLNRHFGVEGERGISWVICGGESGPGARPLHPEWARALRDQCQASGTALMFKQWGEWMPYHESGKGYWESGSGEKVACIGLGINTQKEHFFSNSAVALKVGKARAGRVLDGREWLEFPEVKP